MKARRAARDVALTLASCGLMGCGGGGPVRPNCTDFDSYPLVAPDNAPAWESLASAAAAMAKDPPISTLPLAQQKSECNSEWQGVVAGWSCSKAVDAYCGSSCRSERDQVACREGHHRNELMERCQRESLDKFVAVYPRCEGFHLCNSVLMPKATECPSSP